MRLSGKNLWLVASAVLLASAAAFWIASAGPYYKGKPVSQWAVHYSKRLYPSGTSPLSPSDEGLKALREMGARKAATALVQALEQQESAFYERYRTLHPNLPAWYRKWFPLRLTNQQRVVLILGSVEFFDAQYQKEIVPFLIPFLKAQDSRARIAACQLLGQMPEAAGTALPVLNTLSAAAEPVLAEASQAAALKITTANTRTN